jgi:hypothetical protein
VCDSLESLAFPETPAGLWAASFDWSPTQAGLSATLLAWLYGALWASIMKCVLNCWP